MIKWIVVFDFFHDLIIVLVDPLSLGHVAGNLVRHHFRLLFFRQLPHLVVHVLFHFAAVMVEEVVSCLHSSESLLLWMAEIEVALSIIEERVLAVAKELATSEVTLWAHNFLTDQALHVMFLTTFDSLHFHLEAVHSSHSVLALISSLPSTMQFVMLKVEVFASTDRVLQIWACSLMDPWSGIVGSLLDLFLLDVLWWQLVSCSFLGHQ